MNTPHTMASKVANISEFIDELKALDELSLAYEV